MYPFVVVAEAINSMGFVVFACDRMGWFVLGGTHGFGMFKAGRYPPYGSSRTFLGSGTRV